MRTRSESTLLAPWKNLSLPPPDPDDAIFPKLARLRRSLAEEASDRLEELTPPADDRPGATIIRTGLLGVDPAAAGAATAETASLSPPAPVFLDRFSSLLELSDWLSDDESKMDKKNLLSFCMWTKKPVKVVSDWIFAFCVLTMALDAESDLHL